MSSQLPSLQGDGPTEVDSVTGGWQCWMVVLVWTAESMQFWNETHGGSRNTCPERLKPSHPLSRSSEGSSLLQAQMICSPWSLTPQRLHHKGVTNPQLPKAFLSWDTLGKWPSVFQIPHPSHPQDSQNLWHPPTPTPPVLGVSGSNWGSSIELLLP